MADDAAAVVEQLGLGPVDVVGHSDGGNVALLLARDHPQLVRRVVISVRIFAQGCLPRRCRAEQVVARATSRQASGNNGRVAAKLPDRLRAGQPRRSRSLDDDVGEVLHHVDSPRRDRTRRPQKDLGTGSRHGWRSRFHVDRGNGRDIPGLAEWATHHCAGDWPRNSAETTGTCKSRDT